MNFENLKDELKAFTEITALEILSKKLPLDTIAQLNEPIDMCCVHTTDAPSESIDKHQSEDLKQENG